jgi:hypothetical protein
LNSGQTTLAWPSLTCPSRGSHRVPNSVQTGLKQRSNRLAITFRSPSREDFPKLAKALHDNGLSTIRRSASARILNIPVDVAETKS